MINNLNSNQGAVIVKAQQKRSLFDMGSKSGRIVLQLEKQAEVNCFVLIYQGDAVNKEVIVEIGEMAKARVVAVVIGRDKSNFRLNTILHHKQVNSQGAVVVRSILADKSKLDYEGLIRIDKTASGSDSLLEAKSLALSSSARCKAEPKLEIINNDVKATHSFSQGGLNEEQLFYLESRGVSSKQAKQMIARGFVSDVTSGLSDMQKHKIGRLIDSLVNR